MAETFEFFIRFAMAASAAQVMSLIGTQTFYDYLILMILVNIMQLQIEHSWQRRKETN